MVCQGLICKISPRNWSLKVYNMAVLSHNPRDQEKLDWLRGFLEEVDRDAPTVAPVLKLPCPVCTCVCFVLQLFYRFISKSFQHNSNQLRSSLVCPNWVCCQQSQIEWIVVVWYFGVLDWTRQCHHKHKFNNDLLFPYPQWCQVCPELSSSAASTADFKDID